MEIEHGTKQGIIVILNSVILKKDLILIPIERINSWWQNYQEERPVKREKYWKNRLETFITDKRNKRLA